MTWSLRKSLSEGDRWGSGTSRRAVSDWTWDDTAPPGVNTERCRSQRKREGFCTFFPSNRPLKNKKKEAEWLVNAHVYTSLFQNIRDVLREGISDCGCGSGKVQTRLKGLYSIHLFRLFRLSHSVSRLFPHRLRQIYVDFALSGCFVSSGALRQSSHTQMHLTGWRWRLAVF